jgi:hypothetical protein
MRAALLVLLLAMVLGGAGCSGEDAPDTTTTTTTTSVVVTTSTTTRSLAPSTTSTSVPATTTSSTSLPPGPTVVTVRFGSLFDIVSVPEMVSTPGLEVRVHRARLSNFDNRPNIPTEINVQIDAFLDARRATFVPNPDPSGVPARYALDFEVLWLEHEAWPVLSIVYTETARPAGAAEATTRRFALMFDLPTGEPLTVGDMLTADGVAALEAMVVEALAESFDGTVCCFAPGELVENVGVARDGLRVYVDVDFPEQAGTLEFSFAWAEVMDLIDIRQRFLARRVVEQGGCSVQGEGLVLEEQPDLPEAVAAERRAIFAAAVACDFETLGALVPVDEPDGWFWGFVGTMGGGSAEAWQETEAAGYVPLWFLVRTLNLPYAESTAWSSDEGWHGYVWPAAAEVQPGEWARVPAGQRAELADLYGEEEMAFFAEREWFYGCRVVIRDDGFWWYYGVGTE